MVIFNLINVSFLMCYVDIEHTTQTKHTTQINKYITMHYTITFMLLYSGSLCGGYVMIDDEYYCIATYLTDLIYVI